MSAALGLHGVEVRRGGRTVLAVGRVDVPAGQTLAVLGGNGAGKSTLVRAIGGLVAIDAGERLLDGRPAAGRELRRACTAVLQRPLLRRGTVLANAATGLRFRGAGRREAAAEARVWLERLGVAGLAHRQAATLSGGEAQRVSLARALAVRPRVLLLDEPFTGIDAPTRLELLADVRELLAESGTTAVLVTHERNEAAALAHRIAVLEAGRVVQEGEAAHVLDRPETAAAARLLGYENVLEVDGRAIAIRATDVEIGPRPDAVALAGVVVHAVATGDATRLVLGVGGRTLVADVRGQPPDRGAPVTVALPERALRELRPERGACETPGTGPASPR